MTYHQGQLFQKLKKRTICKRGFTVCDSKSKIVFKIALFKLMIISLFINYPKNKKLVMVSLIF